MNNKKKQHLINREIRANQVRIVDEGIMPINSAIELAESRDLDLVLMSSSSNPPVCKIIDYEKFLYEQGKKEKQKTPELKEIKIGPNTSENYLSYRIIGIGFPFLTIGILSGAVWANEAWGSYWSWDPKETWALLTWLVFAIYLHTRLTKGWEGKKPALIASLGFVTVWICFLGVNLIGEGLHSYGWVSN
jgi:cytochrome c-type biogenesis protein CcsB